MKKGMRVLLLLFAFALAALTLVSCKGEEPDEYKVMLSYGEGVRVLSENPVYVREGESASFSVAFDEGYIFSSVGGATFDQLSGTVTVPAVTKNTMVDIVAEKSDVDPSKMLKFIFNRGSNLDTSSVVPSLEIPAGTLITVEAKDMSRAFVGWRVRGEYVSRERIFTFRLTEDVTDKNGAYNLYSVYQDSNKLIYNLNGGSVNTESTNISGNSYSTVSVKGDEVTVTYSAKYLSYIECGSLFYDDGSFTREGYVLTEYNTRPDGTGEGYSLGSKISLKPVDDKTPTLYCIWSPDTEHSLFVTEEVSIERPATEEYAPHWVESGLKIVGYTGSDSVLTIPEKINGRTVIAIGAGAFVGCDFETVILNRFIHTVEDGAFVGCESLRRMYFPDSMYSMSNSALDAVSVSGLTDIFVNATLAPRHTKSFGFFAAKLSRLMASADENRVIVIGGSSVYQGLGTEYLEALLDDYRVINFGTTRTTHGFIYLEAMKHFAHEGDIILYAPENSSYMFGERELYWKTLRDMEGMVNLYRYIDMTEYTNFFGAFTDYNQSYRYKASPTTYESICEVSAMNKYGDFLASDRGGLSSKYDDVYYITLNERIKSKHEGTWDDANFQEQNKDYTDPENITWCSFTDEDFRSNMNRAIASAKSSGALVYFAFCPVDADKLVDAARSLEWISAYDALILDTFDFDGTLGKAVSAIFAHKYFYDNAFHLNDIGRAYRTYRIYLDLAAILGISEDDILGFTELGVGFDGCIFEGTSGLPDVTFTPED